MKPQNIKYSSVDEGAIGSGAYYFNKYIGGEFTFVRIPMGRMTVLMACTPAPSSAPRWKTSHSFAGTQERALRNLGGPNSDAPATLGHNPYQWGPSLIVGGGMDYNLPFAGGRFGLRLFQADYRYLHNSFGPATNPPTGGATWAAARTLGVAELSTGLLIHFGHIIPAPPPR